jgi:hypothetical protein
MGKERSVAASVPWGDIAAAIAANQQRAVGLKGLSHAAASIAAIPAEEPLAWLPGWTEDTTFTVSDIVSFVLWIRDPMYRGAAAAVRRIMEKEEASALLHGSEKAWKEHAQGTGRARGWCRKHLEEDLRLRSGGGDPAPDAWEAVRTQRRTALLVDYVCTVRSLRVALWWPEHKSVTVIGTGATIVGLNCTSGHVLLGPGTSGWHIDSTAWPALLLTATETTWMPPASAPSIGTMTLTQIQEAIAAIQPDAVKTGGRVVLWHRLLWLRLVHSLSGKTDVD